MEYTHLTRAERNKIYESQCNKWPQGMVAANLGRSRSTVSRELFRNSDQVGYLYPHQADELARGRRQRKCGLKIDKDNKLKQFIIDNLLKRLSPKMISALWKKENPGKKICAETIYKWAYCSDDGKRLNLKKLLVRKKSNRGSKRKPKQPKIKNAVSIHKRPDEINKRQKPGDFECDLFFNKGSQSQNVCNIVDRVTRKSIMIFNKSKHSVVVLGSLMKYIKENGIYVNSITFDNGSEFADHEKLNVLGIKTYFCDPGSPWQKGSIENNNGVARRYLPFEMPADTITPEVVRDAMIKVNNLPREILGFMTANEFSESFNQVASC
jgi:IS30 family transposase